MRKHLLIAAVLLAIPLAATRAFENPPEQERHARSPGKPSHPIQVEVVTTGAVKAGVASEATLRVRSSQPVQAVEVIVTPAPGSTGMVITEDRFQRQAGDFVKGGLELPLHFRPAADGPQPVEVLVRVTAPDGSVMSRTVGLTLDNARKHAPEKRKQAVQVPDHVVESGEDAVVKAKQELKREN